MSHKPTVRASTRPRKATTKRVSGATKPNGKGGAAKKTQVKIDNIQTIHTSVLTTSNRRAGRASKRPAAALHLQIDIDPSVDAGYMHDRYDLLIRGRAVSDQPMDEVALRSNGVEIARMQYGKAEADAQLDLPDGGTATQHAFHFNLPLPCAQARGAISCVIVARTRDGRSHEEAFELSISPAEQTPVSVAAGPTSAALAYAHVKPPILLYTERAVIDRSGFLQVHGWTVALSSIVAVQVFVGQDRVDAAHLGGQRDDVEQAFPAYPSARRSGFTLNVRLNAQQRNTSSIRLQAISADGFAHEMLLPVERVSNLESDLLGHRPAGAAERAPDLHRQFRYFCDEITLDQAGQLTIDGWALCPTGIASITAYVDDELIGDAEIGLLRDDVGDEYSHLPMARFAGFHLAADLGEQSPGQHRVRVVLQNGLDETRTETRTIRITRAKPPPLARAVSDATAQFRFAIDDPTLIAGVAVEPVTGPLTIEGWALAQSGVLGIDVWLDDQHLGEAHYGLARQDVATRFPDWIDALRSGYAFHCPLRSLRNGTHTVQLHIKARNGDILEQQFKIDVHKSSDANDRLSIRRRLSQVETNLAEDVLARLGHRPSFRLMLRQVTPLDSQSLLTTLASLRNQVYQDWSLQIITADIETATAMSSLLDEAAADLASQIDVIDPTSSDAFDGLFGSIDAAANSQFVGFLSVGDEFSCDALLQVSIASGLHRVADLMYADEIRVSPASDEYEPFFKPDFSPDLLSSTNYIGRPWFASAALFARTGITTRSLLAAGEYDAILRVSELADQILHLPKLLCLRGPQLIDDSETEAAALRQAVQRRKLSAELLPGGVAGTWRLRRTVPTTGLVSIIIPTCAARGHIKTCIRSLRKKTAYRNYEIICLDNIPDDKTTWKAWLKKNADIVVPMPSDFNWSQFNNRGARIARGEFLLFLNDDIEIIQPDWLDAMLEHAQRPDVGIVGARLLYPDGKVQHAGMFLATPGTARHAFRFAAADEPGYFGLALTQRNVIAVTGACMLMRRAVYQALDGFDEAHQIINNDLDLCLRAHRAGMLTVFTPHATLVHYEAVSRETMDDGYDLANFERQWKTLFSAGDPYFNPRLSRHSNDYRPDNEPTEAIFAGYPLYRRSDIKRILAVKVDHIGDFVTAIPAIRRLKCLFPAAAIHILASRAARALAATLDCVDEFIEFEFFHPISGLGPRTINESEYDALGERLASYRFDIAVDLRKHLDTRELLRHTGAHLLVGYDYMGQFPFLNITLEWEGDRTLQRKRRHVSDDLINLVEAIGTAGGTERTHLDVDAPEASSLAFLGRNVHALFIKPVVAIHPGVGNVMRQWPAEHFAALIDLLVEQNAVNVVLIGGTEDAKLANQVLGQVINRTAVRSLVGRTSLRDLPTLLRACALYVGNNSGPKHIAAALGVPTIGIHSGVVDATEWGPIGQRAVALRRDMTCSPCYLAKIEDCPRDLACLRGLEPTLVQEVSTVLLARPVAQRISAQLVGPKAKPKLQTGRPPSLSASSKPVKPAATAARRGKATPRPPPSIAHPSKMTQP